jgi:hypothetical protein
MHAYKYIDILKGYICNCSSQTTQWIQKKNYILAPRSTASRRSSESSSPATSSKEDTGHHHELEKAQRPLAF